MQVRKVQSLSKDQNFARWNSTGHGKGEGFWSVTRFPTSMSHRKKQMISPPQRSHSFFWSRGHRCFSGDLVRSLYRSDAEKDSNWYPTDSCPKSQDKSLACHFNWVKGKEARAEVHGANSCQLPTAITTMEWRWHGRKTLCDVFSEVVSCGKVN